MKIILISGKAEHGKDLTASILKEALEKLELTSVCLHFGDYIKDTAREVWGWDGQKDEKGRELLQWWGTDYVRTRFPDFWADTLVRLLRIMPDDFDYIIIPDTRFPNEIMACTWNFGLDVCTVRVNRPGHKSRLTPEQLIHPSETALDNWSFDINLTATNEEELTSEVHNKILPRLIKAAILE